MGNPFEPETREGFEFMGWYMENTFVNLVNFDDLFDLETPSYNVFGFYRVVEDNDPQPELFTLTYVTNTESISYDDIMFEEGDEITPPTPIQDGFTFDGWFTNEELTDFADFDTLLNAEVLEYTVYGSWVMNEVEDEDEEDEIIDDEVDEDDEGDVDGDEDEDDETVDEETKEEETTEEETVVEDDGDVLGDSDEFVEEEKTTEELEDEGEVLGDSDQLPEMNDTNYAAIALFFLIIGLLTVVATKPEQEIV